MRTIVSKKEEEEEEERRKSVEEIRLNRCLAKIGLVWLSSSLNISGEKREKTSPPPPGRKLSCELAHLIEYAQRDRVYTRSVAVETVSAVSGLLRSVKRALRPFWPGPFERTIRGIQISTYSPVYMYIRIYSGHWATVYPKDEMFKCKF